jgi:hypothetical protein
VYPAGSAGAGERLGHGPQVGLQRPDGGDVALASDSGGGSAAWARACRALGGRVAPALHVEVDADLEEAQRRQRPDHVDLGQLAEQLDRAVEPERASWAGRRP